MANNRANRNVTQGNANANPQEGFFGRLLRHFLPGQSNVWITCEPTAPGLLGLQFEVTSNPRAGHLAGSFCDVRKCDAQLTRSQPDKIAREDDIVAVKSLRPVLVSLDEQQPALDQAIQRMQQRLMREVNTMRLLNHQNVIQLLGYVQDNSLYGQRLVTPWYSQNLFRKLGGEEVVSLQDRMKMVDGILNGVEHINALNLVHGDLRPDNIMIDDNSGRPIIIDFGLTSMFQEQFDIAQSDSRNASHKGGSARWMSPERHNEHQVSPADDVYSFGCLLLFILRGECPYHIAGRNEGQFWQRMYQGEPPSSPQQHVDRAPYIPGASPWWGVMQLCWFPAFVAQGQAAAQLPPRLRATFPELCTNVRAVRAAA